MARSDSYSVSDLEKMLEATRAELSSLESRRKQLEAELAEVDSRITTLNGTGAPSAPKRATKKRTKKVAKRAKAASTGGGGGKRPKNQESLRKVIMGILPKGGKGVSLDEVMSSVLATGYRSNATDFRQVVYLNLYNLARKDEIKYNSDAKLYSL